MSNLSFQNFKDNLSWLHVIAFAAWLSFVSLRLFDIPTRAELQANYGAPGKTQALESVLQAHVYALQNKEATFAADVRALSKELVALRVAVARLEAEIKRTH